VKGRSKSRIAVIFNRDFEDAESDPENRAREDIKNVAADVAAVMRAAGHQVSSFGVRDDVHEVMAALRKWQPLVVFNLCESLRGDNRFEALIPLLLEFEGLTYTGSAPQALLQALHKNKAKELIQAHQVSSPRALTVSDARQIFGLAERVQAGPRPLGFPLIVKPSREDASVGICSASVVRTAAELEARVRHVLEHYRQPALVEQFIDGREINVSVLERPGGEAQVLPLHEIDFGEMPDDLPRIVSFEGKWVESSAEFRGTRPVPCQLDAGTRARVEATALAAFRALDLRDYGRVDMRLHADGTPYVIDVNPNCDLSSEGGGFARAAKAAGMSYSDLVLRLFALALERRNDADTIPLAVRSPGAAGADRPEQRSGGAGGDLRSAGGQPVPAGRGGLRHRAPRGGAGSA
jgi:D-alanine-D-alanine ligase